MKKIVLISCASKKLPARAKASELYISPLFKGNLNYAKSLNPDKIFILSAKYGLLNLEEMIEPYNETLNEKSKDERQEWANKVLEKLKQEIDLNNDKIIFLAGEKYREFLLPFIKNFEIPLEGLGIGKQLCFLSGGRCKRLHEIFNNMHKFSFPFNESEIPLNGIYILFEKGENAHGSERIVRIGTHTGENQLPSRLLQHFVNENKDRSIFRKNIGRALLNKDKDSYLNTWEIDTTTREAKEKFGKMVDEEKQKEVEKKVTKQIQDNFSFIVIPIKDKDERLQIESKIISTVSSCKRCNPSQNWLGLFSPKDKIKKSGLWLVNELYKEPLSEEDFKRLKELIDS